jgi:hypothetical protein
MNDQIQNFGRYVPSSKMVHTKLIVLDMFQTEWDRTGVKSYPNCIPTQLDKLMRVKKSAQEHPVDRDSTLIDQTIKQLPIDDPTLGTEPQL